MARFITIRSNQAWRWLYVERNGLTSLPIPKISGAWIAAVLSSKVRADRRHGLSPSPSLRRAAPSRDACTCSRIMIGEISEVANRPLRWPPLLFAAPRCRSCVRNRQYPMISGGNVRSRGFMDNSCYRYSPLSEPCCISHSYNANETFFKSFYHYLLQP